MTSLSQGGDLAKLLEQHRAAEPSRTITEESCGSEWTCTSREHANPAHKTWTDRLYDLLAQVATPAPAAAEEEAPAPTPAAPAPIVVDASASDFDLAGFLASLSPAKRDAAAAEASSSIVPLLLIGAAAIWAFKSGSS